MSLSLLRPYKFKLLSLIRYLKIAGYTDRVLNRFCPGGRQSILNRLTDTQLVSNGSEIKFHSVESLFDQYFLYTPQFVSRSGVEMEADFYFAYKNSVEELDKPIEAISNFKILTLNNELKKTLLIIDGHSLLNLTQQEIENLNQFRLSGGIVLFDHPDLIRTRGGEGLLEMCFQLADFGIVHNPYLRVESYGDRVLLWPTYPFASVFSNVSRNCKRDAVLFSGSAFRGFNGRKYFFNYVAKRGLNVNHNMSAGGIIGKVYTDYPEYLLSLESCILSFTTGYRNRKESLLAFRAVELMLKGVVVLYEEGSFIEYFFKPYVHYVPVKNGPDLYLKSKFLIRNPEIVKRISDNAKLYYQTKFSNNAFWSAVEKKLSNSKRI